MQAGQEQAQKTVEAVQRSAGSSAASTDDRAEFREMLVSLVDPAGLLDMERCGRTAALMESGASRSWYAAGARMSRLLAGIFADIDRIADMAFADIAGNDDEFGHIEAQTTRGPPIGLLGGDRAGGAA